MTPESPQPRHTAAPDPEPVVAQAPEPDTQTQTQTETETETETAPEPGTDTEAETAPEPGTDTEAAAQPETGTDTDTETDQPRLGMWALALVVAVIVAVLGVQSAVSSVQRKEYAKNRATTVFFLRNGNAISTSMERLEEINYKDRSLLSGAASAAESRNTLRFNRFMAQGEVNSDEQLSLQNQVVDYQEAFDKVFLR